MVRIVTGWPIGGSDGLMVRDNGFWCLVVGSEFNSSGVSGSMSSGV